MAIPFDVVEKIARLARLKLAREEAVLYQAQLGTVLEHMADLSGIDSAPAAGARPEGGPSLSNVLREDVPAPFSGREDILANAPQREGSYFKVRKVL